MSKVYVVTGGGSGIGKAVATMLPKEDTVVITGRSLNKLEAVAEELNATGAHIVAKTCDVSKRDSVKELAEYAASLGEVNKVFNCAGISGSMGDVDTIFRINSLGTVYVNQEFYKVMNGGVICDIASDSGYMLVPQLTPTEEVYQLVLNDEEMFFQAVSKYANVAGSPERNANIAYLISKNFAKWYSQNCAFKYSYNKGIRVFSVSPGFVKTPMTDAEQSESTDTMLGYTGLQRGAEAEELAYVITALADDRASYLLGADVICDAGCVNNGYGSMTATIKYDKKCLEQGW